MTPLPAPLQHTVETLCHDGCRAVRGYITQLEQGDSPPGTAHLDAEQRVQVLHELKAIMKVYDRCKD